MSYINNAAQLMTQYPTINDLAIKAKKRIPHISWEYLETGTGSEHLAQRNLDALQAITLKPQLLKGELKPDLATTIFGKKYDLPFGIAPVGLTGLMWPQAEIILAKTAKKYNIPFSLSTVATETPETVGPHMGDMGWFQLYPPREMDLNKLFLDRAKANGFNTLLITADVPTPSRRERTKKAGLNMPQKITPSLIWQGIKCPSWSMATMQRGLPSLRFVESYSEFNTMMSVGGFVRDRLGGNLSWDLAARIRDYWDGPVIIKGILHADDAQKAVELGFDGIVVSNHGGRQFDGGPASIDALPDIVNQVKGKTTIIMDSGLRSGLDIMKAMSRGADFCLLGRSFIYGVCALGDVGGYHVVEILKDELINNMINVGVERLVDL